MKPADTAQARITGYPALLTVTEAATLLRISRNLAYELVAQGRLPHIRLGRVIRISRLGLESWIANESSLPSNPTLLVSLASPRQQ